MSRLCLITLLASSLLYGCAGEMVVARDASRSLALNWDRSEWRFCDTAECAKPTPKSVLLVSSPPLVEPVAQKKQEPARTITTTRTISVPFKFASALVTVQAEKVFRSAFAQRVSGTSILVIGRTDDLGSQAFNDRLAQKRAEAVAEALKRLGVQGDIEIRSQGKCCYTTTNRSEESRAKNRRVELQISSTQKE
jgi:outer membrane protein OmpA-like peptidoglycan-associated protein